MLPAYYTHQLVEQYFDISKGSLKLTPIRVHREETVRGCLLLSMIEATISVHIQKKTKQKATNQEGIFMELINQKCQVYKTATSVEEPQKELTIFIMCLIFHTLKKAVTGCLKFT